MFPINFNFPFRKSNGELTTIGKMIENAGGGGEPYELPPATANNLGGVKIGEGINVTSDGTISVTGGGGGGSTLYRHDIIFKGTTDGAVITIINDSNTAFTDETLKTYFINKNLTDNNKFVMSSGIKVKTNDTSDNITGLFYTSGYNEFRVMTVTSGTWPLAYNSIVDSVSAI